MNYQHAIHMLMIMGMSRQQDALQEACAYLAGQLRTRREFKRQQVQMFGPNDAGIAKINDVYRKVIYLKAADYAVLVRLKDCADLVVHGGTNLFSKVNVQYDFDPMSSI